MSAQQDDKKFEEFKEAIRLKQLLDRKPKNISPEMDFLYTSCQESYLLLGTEKLLSDEFKKVAADTCANILEDHHNVAHQTKLINLIEKTDKDIKKATICGVLLCVLAAAFIAGVVTVAVLVPPVIPMAIASIIALKTIGGIAAASICSAITFFGAASIKSAHSEYKINNNLKAMNKVIKYNITRCQEVIFD